MMDQQLINYQPEYSVLPSGTTDEKLIGMWLHDTSENTQDAYRVDIHQFLEYAGCTIQRLTLPVLQGYADMLKDLGLAPSTRARKIKVVKSLLSFAKKTGYTPLNIGVMIKVPKGKNQLAERILTEEQVILMIGMEKSQRNHAILRLLYSAGLRVSELCDLCWEDIQPRGEAGQITVYGKGEKTRHILLKEGTYKEIGVLRGNADGKEPVFRSQHTNKYTKDTGASKLDPSQVYRIVEQASVRAGIATYTALQRRGEKTLQVTRSHVSPHWLRHAHATHALDNGATIVLVMETLGHESIETTSKYTHAHPDKSSAQYLKM